MNRSPSSALGGIAPLQFRSKAPIDIVHLRVFGSPAQVFVRPTIRDDTKLSDRSVSGTFVGVSNKGNGYIFLIKKLDPLIEVDSKDAKFNETFSEYRERQGKLTTAPFIAADLREEEDVSQTKDSSTIGKDASQVIINASRQIRRIAPRQFLLPGTHQNKEYEIRKQQYSNICMENINDDAAMFLLNCMEVPIDDETKLMKELELLTACATSDDLNVILPFVENSKKINEKKVNLSIPDPKSQSDIEKMDPDDAKKINEATVTEVNGMKSKQVFVNATMDELPNGTKVYQSVVNWTSKTSQSRCLREN
jgi:hypothetical protein